MSVMTIRSKAIHIDADWHEVMPLVNEILSTQYGRCSWNATKRTATLEGPNHPDEPLFSVHLAQMKNGRTTLSVSANFNDDAFNEKQRSSSTALLRKLVNSIAEGLVDDIAEYFEAERLSSATAPGGLG